MIAILTKTFSIGLLVSLVGCGVRGPLYLPNVPPAPLPPVQPEPKGKLYPPQSPAPTTSSSVKQ